ncbi:hypothetical protein [Roseimaritima sediminicola]|uniref:hypothetical protein n=1 Tax=Roseimaritima sediminicola TaxID=2662066 RepID=UPI0012983292|nr:hypothetical protein [Roseimaritima sediminicola]
MDNSVNPYAAPASVMARPIDDGRPASGRVRFWFAQSFAVILVAGSVPASALAVWEIETIIGSAFAFCPVAIALIFIALPPSLRLLWPISIASLGIVAGVFLTIVFNSWSPTDAQKPIGIATIVCATLMQGGWVPIALVGLRHRRSQSDTIDSSPHPSAAVR